MILHGIGEVGNLRYRAAVKLKDSSHLPQIQHVVLEAGGLSVSWEGCSLSPVVASVRQTLVHYFIESAALLDEDLREGSILPEEDGLKAH